MSARPALRAAAGRPVRLGFVGLGWIGRKRLEGLAATDAACIAAICDADIGRLESAASAYPDAAAVSDLAAVLDSDVDGVVIATPNAAHAAQAIACLERGVPVFCQKPLATNAADTARTIAAARRANRLLGVDYCYRHVHGMQALRERIARGELGGLTAIDLVFHNAYGPDKAWCRDRRQSGGGCLLDLGVHLLDLAAWLQGGGLMRVASSHLFARGKALRQCPEAIEDHACVQLEHANGAVIRVACSWNAHAGCDAVIGAEIFGTSGGAAWRNVNGSFYDFTLDVFHGTARERIGSHPDDWGPRSLHAWTERLRHDSSFDDDALCSQQTAVLIEEIYRS